MAQSQNNVEAHGLICGEPSGGLRLASGHYFAHMARHRGLRLADNTCGRH